MDTDLFELDMMDFDVILGIEENHASHVRIVLQTLKDRDLNAMFSKCGFCLKYVAF